MKKSRLNSLPVLMHHLVSNDTTHISVRPANFEAQCKLLAEAGWRGIGLQEAEDFLIQGAALPAKSFLLTFDDGYLDNYVHAWPIMRKYGHKGVIFAIAERIDHSQEQCARAQAAGADLARPTLEEVWSGACAPEALPPVDALTTTDALGFSVRRDLFINWDEARRMEQSGVMALAGHSVRHASVFTSTAYSGFIRPGDQRRTFTQTEPPAFWGLPNFARGPELANRAFIPAPALVRAINDLVPQNEAGAVAFFASPAKVAELERLVDGFKDRLGEMESPDDMARRMRAVMEESRATLRRELGRESKSFCWPWGVFCEEARQQGLAAGFEVFYTTSLGINRPGRPLAVARFKVKNRKDDWLLRRTRLYSRPLLGSLYLAMRL